MTRKSRKEENDWFCKVANQSNKVLKKKSLRSGMDLSLSSKHLLFLSLQRHHIKQRGTINHIWPFLWRPNLPCYQAKRAKSSTTDCGITQLTPNKPKTIDYKSIAIGQWRIDGQLIHCYTCTYNTNPISKPSFYVNCQLLSISLKQQSKQRTPLNKESFASKYFPMENNNH